MFASLASQEEARLQTNLAELQASQSCNKLEKCIMSH